MEVPGAAKGWLRPLTNLEAYLNESHDSGFLVTAYTLTLNSVSPMQEATLKKALTHLFRKVVTFSLCVREKEDGSPWFYRMGNEIIDFQVIDEDVKVAQEKLKSHRYDTFNGPMWCTRLIHLPPSEPCQLPEIKEKFPHQYYLVFGLHHAITDGMSNGTIFDEFNIILNKVAAGLEVCDSDKIGVHLDDGRSNEIIEEVSKEIQKNPKEVEEAKKRLITSIDDCVFIKAFPRPIFTETNPITHNIGHSFTAEQTSKFISRCKKEQISVNSGFNSLINAVLVHLISTAGIKQEYYELIHCHIVNQRQYWKEPVQNVFGCHFGKFTVSTVVSMDILNDFWRHAKEYHKKISHEIKNKACLREQVYWEYLSDDTSSSHINMSEPVNVCFITTNMGNLSSLIRGEGDFVQITDIRRTTSTTNNICAHVVHTFRGRMMYGLDYQSDFMSTETARIYLKAVTDYFVKVINL